MDLSSHNEAPTGIVYRIHRRCLRCHKRPLTMRPPGKMKKESLQTAYLEEIQVRCAAKDAFNDLEQKRVLAVAWKSVGGGMNEGIVTFD